MSFMSPNKSFIKFYIWTIFIPIYRTIYEIIYKFWYKFRFDTRNFDKIDRHIVVYNCLDVDLSTFAPIAG